ncbi:MAG: hypothetical protein H7039_07730, partial [Bryobacteraceae bacterium]|nr:hypothetical protein [Bryobacteraceae bacterium]
MNFVGVCDYALEELEPPDGWRTFASRLRAQRSRTAPLLSRLRPAWLTSAAAAAFAVWWLVLPSGVQPAQASEILAKSSIAQRRAWDTLPGAVVHQTLEITAGPGGKIGWDLWRAPKQARLAERWTGANALRVQIASVCKRSCLDSSDPLSAVAFQRWRDSVVKKSERVDQDKAHGNLTIRTEAESGQLSAASLTIRESDFHPVEQSLKIVSGDGVVDIRIREVSYEVLRMEDVPAGVFETPTVPLLTTSRSQKPVEAQSPASVQDLDVAEARLRQLLHELKIDTSLSP